MRTMGAHGGVFRERQLPVNVMSVGTCQLSVPLQLFSQFVPLFAKATVAPKLAAKQNFGLERETPVNGSIVRSRARRLRSPLIGL